MKPFAYHAPASLDEALSLLHDHAPNGTAAIRPLAGGTDLLTLVKAGVAAPDQLVDVRRIDGLSIQIRVDQQGVTLGALATLADVETGAALPEPYAALRQAAAEAATPQLRNMATIGGNLLQRPRCWYYRSHLFHCWLKGGDECQARDGENRFHSLFGHDQSPCVAVHPSDPAVALAALEARVRVRGAQGERELPIGELFQFPTEERRTETVLRADELITSVHLPAQPDGTRSAYRKAMDRKVWAFAMVSVAVVLRVEQGKITHARLVLGGVANVPWRAHDAEQALLGQAPGEDLFTRAADASLAGATPLEHNAYKIPLAKTLIRRALASLVAV